MTCVAGLIDEKGNVHMACDSEVSDDSSAMSMASPKIAINGDYIIGVSQSLRVLNIMHHASLPPVPSAENLSSFMCIEFIQSVAELMDNMPGTSTPEKLEESTEILVGTKGRLFVIGDDYSVHEHRYPYAVIGGGTLPALGSFFSTEDLSPKARVQKAVKAASEFSAGVRGPIHYLKFGQADD